MRINLSIVISCEMMKNGFESMVEGLRKDIQDTKKYACEFILVNESLSIGNFLRIKDLVKKNSNFVGINLAQKLGRDSAWLAGFQYVTGDIIICMSDVEQVSISEICKMLSALGEKCDVMYASGVNWNKRKRSSILDKVNDKAMQIMLEKPMNLYISDCFVAKRYVIEEIKKYKNAYPYMLGLILRTTKNIENMDVECESVENEAHANNLKKMFSMWINRFTVFTILPLRISEIVGGICAIIGFLLLTFIVIRRIVFGGYIVLGWSSLAAVCLLLGGIIMCMLGILGEYIGRSYMCVNNSPQWVVKEKVGESKLVE